MSKLIVKTDRLVLRPLELSDAKNIQHLAGAWEIADTTLSMPHPYEDGMAEAFIQSQAEEMAAGDGYVFAITRAEIVHRAQSSQSNSDEQDSMFLGVVGLTVQREHYRAELGYWVGVPYWNNGYATEAAGAILSFAFRELLLNRVYATHLSRNPASGRVLEKIGMNHEGRRRQHILKWGEYEDVEEYGITCEDHEGLSRGSRV